MSVTLSHQSALDVIRMLRCEGVSVHDMDVIPLMAPSPWVGRRLNMRNFSSDVWRWQKPNDKRPLHILVSDKQTRVRGKGIVAHVASDDLPAGSILWLDERSSVVCPELLFLQMAETLPLPALVMLGLELCGHFSRQAENPLTGDVVDGLPAATTVKHLERYLSDFRGRRACRKRVWRCNTFTTMRRVRQRLCLPLMLGCLQRMEGTVWGPCCSTSAWS
jgi:hypothetical protein